MKPVLQKKLTAKKAMLKINKKDLSGIHCQTQ